MFRVIDVNSRYSKYPDRMIDLLFFFTGEFRQDETESF